MSSIGFERGHNPDAFADAFLTDVPPRPGRKGRIVAVKWVGKLGVAA